MECSVILLVVTVQGLRQPQLLAYEEGEELEFQACQCKSISSQHLQVPGIGMGVTNALFALWLKACLLAGQTNSLSGGYKEEVQPPILLPHHEETAVCASLPNSPRQQLMRQLLVPG